MVESQEQSIQEVATESAPVEAPAAEATAVAVAEPPAAPEAAPAPRLRLLRPPLPLPQRDGPRVRLRSVRRSPRAGSLST